jgi:hypothetical protein
MLNRVTVAALAAVAAVALAASGADAKVLIKGPMIHTTNPFHAKPPVQVPPKHHNPNINFGSWLKQQYQSNPQSFIAPCRNCR